MKPAGSGPIARAFAAVFAMAIAASSAGGTTLPSNTESPPRPQLLCGADRPLVHPGESVVLRAWIVGEGDAPAARGWEWQSDLGRVQGAAVATWQFGPGELPRQGSTVTATVEAATVGSANPPLRCRLDIVLAELREPATSPDRNKLNAHAFLVRDQEAPEGYGMYSYLLLDAPAVGEVETQRHLNAVALYLTLVRPAAELRAHLRPSSFNLALLPVTREFQFPQGPMNMNEALAQATQVLKVYDYGRAQNLLADFCVKPWGSGPYLIASRDRSGCTRRPLLLDMSNVMPDLVIDWIRSFRTLAAAERSWGAEAMTKLQLNTRNVIALSYRDSTSAAQDLGRLVRLLDTP